MATSGNKSFESMKINSGRTPSTTVDGCLAGRRPLCRRQKKTILPSPRRTEWRSRENLSNRSSSFLGVHQVILATFKSVSCGGPKLTGGASGQGVLRETFGPGPLVEGKETKKKGNMSITVLPPRKFWFLILFSFCLLTVTLYSHFKQSTHAQKNLSFILFLSIISFFFFFRKRTTHTDSDSDSDTHTQKSSLGMLTRSLVAVEPRRPPMTDVGTETAFRLDQCKHFRKSKHLLRSEVN